MASKAKKEAPAPPKAKAKAFKAKRAVLKGIHGHAEDPQGMSPTFRAAQDPRKSAPWRNKLDHYAIIKFLLTTESAMKKIDDNNALVFIVDVKANKHQITQAVKKLYDMDVAKVNTLIRPDAEKKAYVRLAPDYDALAVLTKLGSSRSSSDSDSLGPGHPPRAPRSPGRPCADLTGSHAGAWPSFEPSSLEPASMRAGKAAPRTRVQDRRAREVAGARDSRP
ncbi:60S ribosomal protein L23a-like [Phodopus roborovskii]|uniref:60S ribosomal protein L23a-like n=1 Tax=Phodopus roborovskii TaxID=109678 RepID=UPI0021E3C88B|nr:60S ribosomal protein L23a-like [Phodopus roborovskii]